MKSMVSEMQELTLGLSNFDQSIDEGLEAALKASPGKVCATHSAWEFNGQVWFDGKVFREEVWRYGSIVDQMSSDTLRGLMESVNDKWGWE